LATTAVDDDQDEEDNISIRGKPKEVVHSILFLPKVNSSSFNLDKLKN
jgi:hypothetical protein